MSFNLSRSILSTIATVTLITTLSSSPATASPKKPDPTLSLQVNAAVEPLLLEARKIVSNAFLRVKAVQNQAKAIDSIGRSVADKVRSSTQSYQLSTKEHGAALDALYSAEVAGTTVAAILSLHSQLAEQVGNFRDQAIEGSSGSFISGDPFQGRRRAMSQIVISEKEYLNQVVAILSDNSSWLRSFQAELSLVARQRAGSALPFGFDHYLTLAQQRVDARRLQLTKVSPFFNGVDPQGKTTQPVFECSASAVARFRAFSGDLAIVERWATTQEAFSSNDTNTYSWLRLMKEGPLVAYDGDQRSGNPGYIQTWQSCVRSKQNNITVLSNDIKRALERGETELAKTLDLQRAQLELERTVLEAQLSVVAHRRDQLVRVVNSATAQASAENLKAYPDAWRKTVAAHVKDLNDVATTFPELFATAINLLDAVDTELSSLAGLKDWQEIQTRLGFVIRSIDIIRKDGFERLLSQLESVDESLNAMGSGIANGDVLLSEALAVFEQSTKTKVDFLTKESARIPEKIAAAEARTQKSSTALNQAQDLMNRSMRNQRLYQAKRGELEKAVQLYASTFSSARLNPIYTALVNELMKRATTNRNVAKQRADLDARLRQILLSFNGIVTTPNSNDKCAKGGANCPKTPKVRIANAAARALKATQASMLPETASLVNSLSRSQAGSTLPDLVGKIEAGYKSIMNIK